MRSQMDTPRSFSSRVGSAACQLAIRTAQLYVKDVLVTLPSLVQHETAVSGLVPMQDRLMKHGFVPHVI